MRGIVNYTPLCMIIELMLNGSENNVVSKELSGIITLEGHLRDESPVSKPSILVDYGDIIIANYAHIPAFKRYYYISECIQVRTGLWRLELVCDVLMSFAMGIQQSTAIVEESTSTGIDNYLENDVWVSKVKDSTEIINFPSGFPTSGEYILITAGGD